MLTVRLKDVLSAPPAADDKAPVIGLDKHILRPRSLDIVDHRASRPTLARAQASMLASGDTRVFGLTLHSFGGLIVGVRHGYS